MIFDNFSGLNYAPDDDYDEEVEEELDEDEMSFEDRQKYMYMIHKGHKEKYSNKNI